MNKNALVWALAVAILATGAYLLLSRYAAAPLDGTDGVSVPQEGKLQYSSEEGYSFMYPDTYELSSRTETSGAQTWDVLVLLPKGYVAPEGGEGPPSISIASYSNAEGLPLEVFIQNEPKANFELSGDKKLTPTTAGGKEALAYQHSGLYETDAVAVEANGRVLIFAAGWMNADDKTRQDLQDILKSVQFANAR